MSTTVEHAFDPAALLANQTAPKVEVTGKIDGKNRASSANKWKNRGQRDSIWHMHQNRSTAAIPQHREPKSS
jgi:hypothetical protein